MTSLSRITWLGYVPALAFLVSAVAFIVLGLLASSLVPIVIAAALGSAGVIKLATLPRDRMAEYTATAPEPSERRHPDARTSVTSGDEQRSASAGGGFFGGM